MMVIVQRSTAQKVDFFFQNVWTMGTAMLLSNKSIVD